MSKRRKNIKQLNGEKRAKNEDQKSHKMTVTMSSPYFITNETTNRIDLHFFRNVSTIQLSKALLGQILCRRLSPNGPILKGTIVETEAYLGLKDMACHTYNGRRSDSNEPMYMSCGTCYVYFTYGMYYCFNISSEGEGEAVLLRAVEPEDNAEAIDCMQRLRSKARKKSNDSEPKPYKLKELTNGPSKLCIAFDINKDKINKLNITNNDEIWLERGVSVCESDIVTTKRIGITRAGLWNDKPLRFYIKDSQFVSQK